MTECIGCKREFRNKGGLNSHKRFCKEWQALDLQVRKTKDRLSLEERKNRKASCPNCSKEFINVYSMSAHKGHCLGLTPHYRDHSQEAKDKQAWSRGKVLKEHAEIFCIGIKNRTGYVKNALYKFDIKEHRCENCSLTEWMGTSIPIELDHINGNNLDNRLENLRFLCCNCHAQTPTWRGRNVVIKNQTRTKTIIID